MAKLTTYIIMGIVSAFMVAMMFVGGTSVQIHSDPSVDIVNIVVDTSEPEVVADAEVKTIVSSEFPPGYNNPDVTEMQKTAYFDTYLKGEYVQWMGVVSDVSMSGKGTVKISVDHGSGMQSNALVRMADGQVEKAITLKRGDVVTYTAKMTRWGSFLGFYGEDGEIV